MYRTEAETHLLGRIQRSVVRDLEDFGGAKLLSDVLDDLTQLSGLSSKRAYDVVDSLRRRGLVGITGYHQNDEAFMTQYELGAVLDVSPTYYDEHVIYLKEARNG